MQCDVPVVISISDRNGISINIDNEKKFPVIVFNQSQYSEYVRQVFVNLLESHNKQEVLSNEQYIDVIHPNRLSYLDKQTYMNEVEAKYKDQFEKLYKQKEAKLNEDLERKINSYDSMIKAKNTEMECAYDGNLKELEYNTKQKHLDLEARFKLKEIENDIRIKDITSKYEILNASIDDRVYARFGEKEKEYIIDLERKDKEICLLKQSAESSLSIHTELSEIKTSFQKMFKSDKSIVGSCGEDFIYELLKEHLVFADASIEKVNGSSNACDLFLSYENIRCGIESKNHTGLIRLDQIKRFTSTDICNPKYNSGIFVSLRSGFVSSARVKHFDVKFYNNKPVIFLEEVLRRPEHLIIAVKVLAFIVSSNSTKENQVQTIVSTVQSYISTLDKIQNSNKQIVKIANESYKEIQNVIDSINGLLYIKKTEEQFFKQFTQQVKLREVHEAFCEWSGNTDVKLKTVKQLADKHGMDIVKIQSVLYCQVKE